MKRNIFLLIIVCSFSNLFAQSDDENLAGPRYYQGEIPIRTGFNYDENVDDLYTAKDMLNDDGSSSDGAQNYWLLVKETGAEIKTTFVSTGSSWIKLYNLPGHKAKWLESVTQDAGIYDYRLNICVDKIMTNRNPVKFVGYMSADNTLKDVFIDGEKVFSFCPAGNSEYTYEEQDGSICTSTVGCKCGTNRHFDAFILIEFEIPKSLLTRGVHTLEFKVNNEKKNTETGLFVDGSISNLSGTILPLNGDAPLSCSSTGMIRGKVFDDNGNNCKESDIGDGSVANAKVILVDFNTRNEVQVTYTNSDGDYSFRNVDPNRSYQVLIEPSIELAYSSFSNGVSSSSYPIVTPEHFSSNYNVVLDVQIGGYYSCNGGCFEPSCPNLSMEIGENCIDSKSYFTINGATSNNTINWNFGNGISETVAEGVATNYQYPTPGIYDVSATITSVCNCEVVILEKQIEIKTCTNCTECVPSFQPIPGEKYTISAWVKEDNPGVSTYSNPAIVLDFENADDIGPLKATGTIIDGWQKIEYTFIVPITATAINVRLKNLGTEDVFFDDIRIHPFNSNMKSFVYDPLTLRLHSELDENNFATYYEYDEEGALVRVKKETQRGVKTINETRQNLSKQK